MLDTLYRIHTQATPEYLATIDRLVSSKFDAYTVILGRGMWKGVAEDAATIEILAESKDSVHIEWIAAAIKCENQQEAVLVSRTVVSAELI